MTAFWIFGELAQRSPSGHFDPFPPHRPNAGYVIGKETVAWAPGVSEMRRLRHSPDIVDS
jgi:hypothetical protein